MGLTRKKRSPIWKMPADQFARLVHGSKTIGEILTSFNLANKGGNYKTVYARIEAESIDSSHIVRGKGHNTGKHFPGKAISLDCVLVEHSTYSRHCLKRRLIKEGLLENKCANCGQLPVWGGKPLVLRLDHFNGTNDDNRLENLRLLCPNCDSQMDTFCGRNYAKARTQPKSKNTMLKPGGCTICRKQIDRRSHGKCRDCNSTMPRPNQRKIDWPSLSELQDRIAASSVLQVSKQLGVSDVAVHKMVARMSRAH